MSGQEASKNKLYGNCGVYHPNGSLMFYCSEKKRNFYLKNNLAQKINDVNIKLTFTPNGLGPGVDEFHANPRPNRCCVCGEKDLLTRHHIVPYQYKKCFPDNWKKFSSHDVLPVCLKCHKECEEKNDKMKQTLAKMVNCAWGDEHEEINKELTPVIHCAKLLNKGKKNIPYIPYSVLSRLQDTIDEYLNRPYTEKDLEDLSNIKNYTVRCHSEEVVRYFKDSLYDFVVMWRRKFVEEMNPKFLPLGWRIDYKGKYND